MHQDSGELLSDPYLLSLLKSTLGVGLPGWCLPESRSNELRCGRAVQLVDLAVAHRVAPQLAMAADRGIGLDAAARTRLRGALAEAVRTSLLQEWSILRSVDVLEAANIEVRLLKGQALSRTVYPEPSLRTSGDVDVLVRGADFDAARHALERSGARPLPSRALGPAFDELEKAVTFVDELGVEIDLHRKVHGEVSRSGITEEDLFADPTEVTVADRTVLGLSTDAALVHAAIHSTMIFHRLSSELDLLWLAHSQTVSASNCVRIAQRGGSIGALKRALVERPVASPGLPTTLSSEIARVQLGRRDRTTQALALERPGLRFLIKIRDAPLRRWPALVRDLVWPSREFLDTMGRRRSSHYRHMLSRRPVRPDRTQG